MASKKFSKKEAIIFGWQTFKKNSGLFIKLFLVLMAVNFLPGIINSALTNINSGFGFIGTLISLAFWPVQMIASIGVVKIALKFVDGGKAEIKEIFSYRSLFFKYFLGSVVYGLIVLAGLILLIVPGVIWAVKYSLWQYFVVDKEMGSLEAIKASGRATKGEKFNLFLFGLLVSLINFLGVLAIVLGLFVTIPVTYLAMAYVYRKLEKQMGA